MKKISVVIPALNEKDGITKTINDIPRSKLAVMGYDVQVVVVDGISNDGTAERAREAGAEVILERRRGYGQAYKKGFAYADGDIIITADADATYPMEDIPRLVSILEQEELDFITTDRLSYLAKDVMSFRNRVGNAILTLTTNLLFRLNIKDCQSGMWVFKKSILERLVLKSNTPFSQEIKIEVGHFTKSRWREVPIQYRPRLGKTKCGGWKVGLVNYCDLFRKRLIR
jgi:glycosyltransferase involved in cell wall biosynthesis